MKVAVLHRPWGTDGVAQPEAATMAKNPKNKSAGYCDSPA